MTLPGNGNVHLSGCYSDRMPRRATKSVPGQIIPPAPSNQPIPGRKRGLAPLIRATHVRYPELSGAGIAKRVGCSRSNVCQVLGRFLGKHSVEELRDFQDNKADIYDAIQHRTLSAITDETLAKCSALQLITGAAILEDKARLVGGQPTSLHVHALIDVLKAIRAKRQHGYSEQVQDGASE